MGNGGKALFFPPGVHFYKGVMSHENYKYPHIHCISTRYCESNCLNITVILINNQFNSPPDQQQSTGSRPHFITDSELTKKEEEMCYLTDLRDVQPTVLHMLQMFDGWD